MIRIEKLNKYFNRGKNNENHVLKDINLELDDHGLVCILGESGSGKTTLLNTLGGLDVFQQGSLAVDDEVMERYEAKQMEQIRNSKFGYIFQNYYLLQDYTVSYNVKLALNMFELSDEEKEERTDYVLEALGMKKYKKKLVSQLSGGQQQRVSIARALVKSPEIILADEPTGNLDEDNTLQTMSILKSISKECLVVLVSHEKAIAKFFADRIIEIQDGVIKRDYVNTPSDSYEKTDDANIYLKDQKEEIQTIGKLELHLFEREDATSVPEKGQEKIRLNLAWKDGKLFLQGEEEVTLVLAGEESGTELIDAHRPKLEVQQLDEVEYELPKMTAKKDACLSGKEIRKMAMENIRLLGKRQAFVIGILVVASIMLTVALADYMTQRSVDRKQFITDDSHYVTVDLKEAASVNATDMNKQVQSYYDQYVGKGDYQNVFVSSISNLKLIYSGFKQLTQVEGKLENYAMVSLSNLDKKDLIYGRMPKNRNEIVVDRWLLQCFADSDNILSTVLTKDQSFVGLQAMTPASTVALTIVGISDNQEPSIYMYDSLSMQMNFDGTYVLTDQEMRELYPEKYGDLKLEDNQVLMLASDYKYYKDMKEESGQDAYRDKLNLLLGQECEVVGDFPDDLGPTVICSETAAKRCRITSMQETRSFKVYTDDVDQTIAYFQSTGKGYENFFTVDPVCQYRKQMKDYQDQKRPDMNLKSLLTVAIFLLSLTMVFFTIKSNAVSRSEELTVYRLIGIAQSSIRKAYMLEMVLVTVYTCVPAILVTSGVLKFIAGIPSLEINLTFPWWSVMLLILVMIGANSLISILPVEGILRKPPAQLAVKE